MAKSTALQMEFIKRHPTSKFLILTHGTNVLKNQWAKELFNNKIEASTVPGESRVTYGLPQGKRQLAKLGKIDYLIVVEAHEFKIPTWISTGEAQINARNANQDWNSISDEEKEKHILVFYQNALII